MRALITVAALLFVLSAQAQTTPQEWAKLTEERASRLAELSAQDLTGEAGPHIEVVRTLLNRAESHLANEDLDALPPLFERIDRLIAYVVAMEERMVAEKNADALEQEAAFAEQKAEEAEAVVAELQARFDALEEKGL